MNSHAVATDRRKLVDWIADPRPDRGIRFAESEGRWDFWTYARIATSTRRFARGLTEAGVRRDEVVTLSLRSPPAFVTAFFGTLLRGATPSPVAPPLLFESAAAYEGHFATVLAAARPAIVVTDAEALGDIAARQEPAVPVCAPEDLLAGEAPGAPAEPLAPPAIGVLQFTSGSSAVCRGVRVPSSALAANVFAIRHWLRWRDADAFASWLPLHHDMGLIGALVSSVVGQSDLWLLQPEQFVRRPARYIRCFGRGGAALSVMPSFGLEYVVRRVKPAALEGCDLSGWRQLVVGAERIDADALERFTSLLAPFGFDPLALRPAYGLAEATLAVTGVPSGESWTSLAVDPDSLSLCRAVDAPRPGGAAQVVVGCGRPLAGMSVSVVDEADRPLAAGRVGEIRVEGTSLAAGYAGERDEPATRFDRGRLRTGDAGFLHDGQLFVLGRLGDSTKVRGRVVFSEDLELAVSKHAAGRERVAVLLGVHRGRPTAVVVIERFQGRPEEVLALIRLHAGEVDGCVIDAPAGTIARTTSGKPKRRRLWRSFVAGTLPGTVMRA